MPSELRSADVIVVGAGVSGCIVARRLVESGRSVVLIEAGPGLPLPAGMRRLSVDDSVPMSRSWRRVAQASESGSAPYVQGRGVGGSGAINGAVLSRPSMAELDAWRAATGCDLWSGEVFNSWIDRALGGLGSTVEIRGTSDFALEETLRPLPPAGDETTLSGQPGRLLIPVLAAGTADDGSVVRVLTADRLAGLGAGLRLLTGSTALRVLRSRGRATGVELASGQVVRSGEVVLCGGALQTPLLLMRSGILGSNQIEAVDHSSLALRFRWPVSPLASGSGCQALVRRVCRWTPEPLMGAGRLDDVVAHVIGPFQSKMEEGAPPTGLVLLSPGVASRHAVTLATNGETAMVGAPKWMAGRTGSVASCMRAAVLQLFDSLSAADLHPSFEHSRRDLRCRDFDDAEAAWHVMRQFPGPTFHIAGTLRSSCESSSRPGRLIGPANVFVADASLLPDLPAIGPQLTVMAVAEAVSAAVGA